MEGLVSNEFWKGKRVFLTGHTGFKGSWLCLWLREMGAHVTGYALAPHTNPSLFELARVAEDIESIIGDVRDSDGLTAAIGRAKPEIVIHLAAQPLVRASYSDPIATYATNVMGTVHLLEAVHHSQTVRSVVVVTSDKCYENREWVWGYRESDPMGGFDPYSSSKGCAEIITSAFRSSFFPTSQYHRHEVMVASARAGNIISGGDWSEDRLVPDLIRAFLEERAAVIRNPQAIRPWQNVLDPLRGYLLLAEQLYNGNPDCAGAFNFGPSEADVRPVSWIVENFVRVWGRPADYTVEATDGPHEAVCLKLESSKARLLLKWAPRSGVEQTINNTVCWYKSYATGEDMRLITLDQIRSYQSGFSLAL